MPIQKWTCETCGRTYNTVQDASLCELTHNSNSKTKQSFTAYPNSINRILQINKHVELDLKQDDPSWGVHINQTSRHKSEKCPDWVHRAQSDRWRERGMIIWDKQVQKVTRLRSADALDVLEYLQQNGTEAEILLGEPWMQFSLDHPEQKPKPVLESEIPLNSTQSRELLKFLQDNQALLQQMANEDAEKQKRALESAYSILIRAYLRKIQEEHVDKQQP